MTVPHNERKMALLGVWGRLTHKLVLNEDGSWSYSNRPAILHQATKLKLSVQLSQSHYSSGQNEPFPDHPELVEYDSPSVQWECMVVDWGTWINKRAFGLERMGESVFDRSDDPEDYAGPFGWVRSGYIARHFTEADWLLAIKEAKNLLGADLPYSPLPNRRGGRKIELC